MKIALGLFALNTTCGHLLSVPEFVRGLLFSLSLFFMIIGLMPDEKYRKLLIRQRQKVSDIKGFVGMTKNAP